MHISFWGKKHEAILLCNTSTISFPVLDSLLNVLAQLFATDSFTEWQMDVQSQHKKKKRSGDSPEFS